MAKQAKFSCPCGRTHVIKLVKGALKHEVSGKPKGEEKPVDDSADEDNGKSGGATLKDFFMGSGAFAAEDEVSVEDDDSKDDDDES